jgi:hypothetical protein
VADVPAPETKKFLREKTASRDSTQAPGGLSQNPLGRVVGIPLNWAQQSRLMSCIIGTVHGVLSCSQTRVAWDRFIEDGKLLFARDQISGNHGRTPEP